MMIKLCILRDCCIHLHVFKCVYELEFLLLKGFTLFLFGKCSLYVLATRKRTVKIPQTSKCPDCVAVSSIPTGKIEVIYLSDKNVCTSLRAYVCI